MTENKIALSIDIEDWYHTPLVTGSSFSKYKSIYQFFENWKEKYDYITNSTIEIIDLLNQKKIKATFFLVADIIERYPDIVKALKESHHEIGCHGLHHSCALDGKTKKMLQNKDVWKGELIKAKNILESTFNRKIIGYRAPSAYFGKWMISILEEINFKYDSSIASNSLYNKTDISLSLTPSYPFYLKDYNPSGITNQSNLMELPWSFYKIFFIRLPGGGAFFYRLLGNKYFIPLLKQNLKRGDTMFYFHALDLVEDKFPTHANPYRPFYWINKGKKTKKYLQKLLERFSDKFLTCEEIYKKNCN